jgi:hypothetical protein
VLRKSTTVMALVFSLLAGSLFGSLVGSATSARAADEPDGALATMPARAVVAFNRQSCPNGWSQFAPAEGRVVVGLNPGGALRGRVGIPLGDKEKRRHTHLVDPPTRATTNVGSHDHIWASYSNGEWLAPLGGADFVAWGDGMDSAGSGYYPLAVDSKGGPNSFDSFTTSYAGGHFHQVDIDPVMTTAKWDRIPYIQLLMCIKN